MRRGTPRSRAAQLASGRNTPVGRAAWRTGTVTRSASESRPGTSDPGTRTGSSTPRGKTPSARRGSGANRRSPDPPGELPAAPQDGGAGVAGEAGDERQAEHGGRRPRDRAHPPDPVPGEDPVAAKSGGGGEEGPGRSRAGRPG